LERWKKGLTALEQILATFEGRKPDRIAWQPRIDHWYDVNKKLGTLPPQYRKKGLLEIYDDLLASPRTYLFFDPTVRAIEDESVEKEVVEDEEKIVTTYATPVGKLRDVQTRTEYGTTTYHTEYLLKSVDDFRIMTYILRGRRYEFDRQLYDKVINMIGERSQPIINVRWGSIQRLTVEWMGFERTVLSLWKNPREVDDFIQEIEYNDDKWFDCIKRTPFKFVCFADNIDQDLISPPMFEKYMLPRYKKRTSELHEARKICVSHWDGNVKLLAKYARETGLDALECVPPYPMGNITLEELHNATKGMILFDVLPASYFLDLVTREDLEKLTKRILELFSPRIILGISDQLPANGDIEKVRIVSKIVQSFVP
jgi:hypothetical protein